MSILSKIIYLLSIAYIVLCCTLAILLNSIPLEFKSYRLSENADQLFFFGIPIAVLFTLARLGFKDRRNLVVWKEVLKTVGLSVGIFIVFFFYAIASFGSSMCRTTTGQTIFTKSNSSTTKIVERHFGCGATDSGPGIITIAKQVDILSIFWYYSEIDTIGIAKSDWIPVVQ